jgi:3-isopropylmalate dehydrogenase
MGADAIDKTGSPLPPETIEVCLESDAVLFGAIGLPKYDNNPAAVIRPEQGLFKLRNALQLYANIRPVKTFPSLHHLSPVKVDRLENVDFVIYRELSAGLYMGNKQINEDFNEAFDESRYNKTQVERIAHLAFQAAQKRKKKLTLVDRANVLDTSRLWRATVQQMAAAYTDVAVNYMFVDNAVVQIIINPKQFDVVLTQNMFGDILSSQASVLSGSLGVSPSASVGLSTPMFEPIHGTYPQAAGKDIANPIGSILSAALMLDYLEMPQEAALVREAVEWTQDHGFVTKDINSHSFYFTSTIGDVVCDYISKGTLNVNFGNVMLRKSTII